MTVLEHKVNPSMYAQTRNEREVNGLVRSRGLKKLHIQLIPTERNKKNKLLGRTMRVSHYDEMGYWLASDKTVCIPYEQAVVCQAISPNFGQADVYVSMAKNITALLADLPQLEERQWVQITELDVQNGVPYISLEEEVAGSDGESERMYYPAHAFLFSFYPREFNAKHYASKGYKEVPEGYVTHTFAGPYDETKLVVAVTMQVSDNRVTGYSIFDTSQKAFITEVGHFASVEDAQAYKLEA